jgi:hypothetical protein
MRAVRIRRARTAAVAVAAGSFPLSIRDWRSIRVRPIHSSDAARPPFEPCWPTACNGRGVCTATTQGPRCACDEVFGAPDCFARNVEYGQRIKVSWNVLGAGLAYSLDLVLRDGSVGGPCIAVTRIGQNTSTAFAGGPDAGDRLALKSEVRAFRLYASPNDVFVRVGETPYDGYSDVGTIVATAP